MALFIEYWGAQMPSGVLTQTTLPLSLISTARRKRACRPTGEGPMMLNAKRSRTHNSHSFSLSFSLLANYLLIKFFKANFSDFAFLFLLFLFFPPLSSPFSPFLPFFLSLSLFLSPFLLFLFFPFSPLINFFKANFSDFASLFLLFLFFPPLSSPFFSLPPFSLSLSLSLSLFLSPFLLFLFFPFSP